MDVTDRQRGRRGSNRAIVILATLALVISLATWVQMWAFRNNVRLQAYPGSAYIVLLDNDENVTGSIADDYGRNLKLTRLDPQRAHRVEMKFGDAGASIRLYKNEKPVAEWSVSEEGEKFEKLKSE